jgi:hypothetical protein
VAQEATTDQLERRQIMRTAGQVEALLGLTAHTEFDRRRNQDRRGDGSNQIKAGARKKNRRVVIFHYFSALKSV